MNCDFADLIFIAESLSGRIWDFKYPTTGNRYRQSTDKVFLPAMDEELSENTIKVCKRFVDKFNLPCGNTRGEALRNIERCIDMMLSK